MIAILKSVGVWILKLFLSGLFNREITKTEMEADQTKKAAGLYVEEADKAREVEKQIEQDKAKVDELYKAPTDHSDPLGYNAFNKGGVK